jgi:small subunit ribosomal protein S18
MPRRLTGNSKDAQDMVELAIKRARHMAIIPFIASKHVVAQTIEDMEQ